MTGKLKTAFDGICAEDCLKANTVLFLQKEIRRRGIAQKRVALSRYAIAIASIAIIIVSGMFSYNLYFTPNAYVDLDVNPSIGLTLNKFDRVIGVHAYNEEGEQVLTGLHLKYKKYNDALIVLIDTMDQKGYIQNDGLVSVTLQTDNKETKLLDNIQTGVESYITGHHHETQIDVFAVSGDTRSQAYEQGITPAKYLAIQELIELDPTVTVESCRGNSISEIKQQAREHGNHQHNNTDVAVDDGGVENAHEEAVGNGHHHGGNSAKRQAFLNP